MTGRSGLVVLPSDLGYTAGLLDGEGSVGLNKHKNKSLRGWNYQPCVSISNTVLSLVTWVKDITDIGSVNSKDYKKRNKRHKIPYVWQVFDMKQIMMFLTLMLPHLKIKGERAELLIEFCGYRLIQLAGWKPLRDCRGRFIRCELAYSDRQHEIYERLKILNG